MKDLNFKILVPAYNSERYVNDLFHRFEEMDLLDKVVVVDDGSRDNTLQICEDRKVTVLSNETNGGKGSALKKGFKEGLIDCIATDHAPHALFEKEMEFGSAPFGIIGLETALGIICTELLHTGILTIKEIVEKFSINPAKILGIGERSLKKGQDAYITIFDPDKEWTVKVDDFASKSSNSPYDGWKLKGCAVITIVKGKIVYREGEFFK